MDILIISDIHANFPALAAIAAHFESRCFAAIINAGDSVVYGPFPNETLEWLHRKNTCSILGNTDKKALKLVAGKSFKKPAKLEKRIMYTWTADNLGQPNADYLRSLPTSRHIELEVEGKTFTIGIFHGSPRDDNEFLFPHTPIEYLSELSALTPADIVITGHSHTPFHRCAGKTHFVNPGSTGRMFDGDPRASCAILSIKKETVLIEHFRISYPVQLVVEGLRKADLPEIYEKMFIIGKKLN
jgi:putative phosphoesterase